MALGCARKCCTPPPANYIQANRNLAPWFKQTATFIATADSLTLIGQGTDDMLTIKLKYTSTGKYNLSGNQVRYTINAANGTTGVVYVVDNTKENFVDFSFNESMKITGGNFSLNLIKAPGYDAVDNAYPVTMTFANGTFMLELGK